MLSLVDLVSLICKKQRNNNVTSLQQYEHTITMGVIQFPVNIKDIEKFEKLNTDISINVLGYENKELYPLRVKKIHVD